MNMRIFANSNVLVAIGFTMFLGGMVGSLALLNFWLLLLIPVSLVFMLRLETDADRVELSELKKRGARVVVSQQQMYGVLGEYFVQAMLTGEHLSAAKSLMERSAANWLDSADSLADNLPANMRVWPLNQIDQVKFSTDAKSFSILTNLERSEVLTWSPDERDKVLKILKSKVEWGIETSYRKNSEDAMVGCDRLFAGSIFFNISDLNFHRDSATPTDATGDLGGCRACSWQS